MTRGEQTYWYHFDGLGSTRQLTNEAGEVTDTYDYDAFGNLLARTGTTESPFLFTGQRYDANVGFYHLRARYYQPTTGRFTTVDPWAGDQYAPTTLHKYLYTANDPVDRIDPSGKDWNLTSIVTTISVSVSISYNAFMRLGDIVVTRGTAIISNLVSYMRAPAVSNNVARFEEIAAEAAEQYPKLANLPNQLHHIYPQYLIRHLAELGIEIPPSIANKVVELPAAYHQVLTNAIRAAYPFGNKVFSRNPADWAEIAKTLSEIYMKYNTPIEEAL